MKKKILICTLCLTIVFSSLNYKKSYADGGVISLPMLGVISALAVGSNIIINNSDDLYDLGRMFYDYVDRHNDLTWATVQALFASGVSLQSNNFISVNGSFLDTVKDFFDNTFNFDSNVSNVSTVLGFPVLMSTSSFSSIENRYNELDNFGFRLDTSSIVDGSSYVIGSLKVVASSDNLYFYVNNARLGTFYNYSATLFLDLFVCDYKGYTLFGGYKLNSSNRKSVINIGKFSSLSSSSVISFPYIGGYSWDNVESKKENESVSLPIPGDLGQLVGQGVTDFWDNTDNLVGSGEISIPSVSDPSISLDGTTSFPNTNVDTGNPSIPDTGNPSIPNNGLDIFPPWGGGIDFTPVTQSSFIDKFPFSLGNDIKNILNIFDVEPVAPRFKVPIVSETIELDLTEFEQLASIVRFFILVGFIISLILITRSVIG